VWRKKNVEILVAEGKMAPLVTSVGENVCPDNVAEGKMAPLVTSVEENAQEKIASLVTSVEEISSKSIKRKSNFGTS
jgi:hypothetical protein